MWKLGIKKQPWLFELIKAVMFSPTEYNNPSLKALTCQDVMKDPMGQMISLDYVQCEDIEVN